MLLERLRANQGRLEQCLSEIEITKLPTTGDVRLELALGARQQLHFVAWASKPHVPIANKLAKAIVSASEMHQHRLLAAR
jgi:hypothetical protein